MSKIVGFNGSRLSEPTALLKNSFIIMNTGIPASLSVETENTVLANI